MPEFLNVNILEAFTMEIFLFYINIELYVFLKMAFYFTHLRHKLFFLFLFIHEYQIMLISDICLMKILSCFFHVIIYF